MKLSGNYRKVYANHSKLVTSQPSNIALLLEELNSNICWTYMNHQDLYNSTGCVLYTDLTEAEKLKVDDWEQEIIDIREFTNDNTD